MKISKTKLILRWLLLAAVCAVIFWFSSNNADDSSSQSGFLVETIVRVFFKNMNSYSAERAQAIRDILTVIVRKSGHFCEYALMGAMAFAAFVFIRRYGFRVLSAFLLGAAYACTDELHQIFVPGRAGMITDIFIDSAGVLAGVLFGLMISMLYTAHCLIKKYGRNENDNSKQVQN